jgi:dienelactone hydrolase
MRARYTLVGIAGGIGLLLLGVGSSTAQVSDGGYRVFKPDGPGPHAGVVFVSGCSGFAPSFAPGAYERIAEQLRGQGHMVVFADYLGRWNLKSCAGAPITHADAAKELVAAATWLKSQPSIDPARITALGWSYGGGAVLVALARYTEGQLGFTQAVVYYPDCRSVRPWKLAVPVLMLLAGDDDVAPGKSCRQAAEKSAAPDVVKTVIYPGALHGFDVSELPPKMKYPAGTLGYHPQAAAAAWEEIQRFLQSPK